MDSRLSGASSSSRDSGVGRHGSSSTGVNDQDAEGGFAGTDLGTLHVPIPSGSAAGSRTTALERRIELGATAGRSSNRAAFPSNYVSTTKYELWNIVPKNLWEQFHRVANVWFLIVSIFQMLPLELSPTNKYATFFPLCCVLFVTFCKDAWEDYGRRRDDRRVNTQLCMVVDDSDREGRPRPEIWKDVAVGAFLRLRRDEPVPADMVLLACSNEDGVAYVDTAQLDGETSLKPKFALEETMRITEMKELLALAGHLDTEPPNQLVQSFNGTLFLQGFPRGVSIDAKSFLLRGSTLRNTSWVYGVVVFTGYDTKLVQNLRSTPSKRSRVEVTANMLLLIVFGILFLAAAVSAVARALYSFGSTAHSAHMKWAWPEPDPLRDNNLLAFITFMIGYNNLIPISLYVTTDLARTLQGVRMELDSSMYHAETNSPCRVRNSGLNEDLGQVEFVLTDKTGTLTENKMEFKACSIGGKVYGRWDEEKGPVDHIVAVPSTHICQPLNPAFAMRTEYSGRRKSMPSSPSVCVYGKWDEEKGAVGTAELGAGMGANISGGDNIAEDPLPADQEAPPASASQRFIFPSMTCIPMDVTGLAEESAIEDMMVDHFFLCLATCHTAIVEQLPGALGRTPEPRGAVSTTPCTTISATATHGATSGGLGGAEAGAASPHPSALEGSMSGGSAGPRPLLGNSPTASPTVTSVAGARTGSSVAAAAAAAAAASVAAASIAPPAGRVGPRDAVGNGEASNCAGNGTLGANITGHCGEQGFHPTSSLSMGGMASNHQSPMRTAKESPEELREEAMSAAFRSSSPDEEALVAAARDYGYFFRRKVASRLTVNVRGKDKYFQVLICNEFTSERKRMSVLVQRIDPAQALEKSPSQGSAENPLSRRLDTIMSTATASLTFDKMSDEASEWSNASERPAMLYAKGADNVMLERLANAGEGYEAVTRRHTQQFASQGLRTLILAQRELSSDQVSYFVKKMHEAKGAFMNRDSMMEAVANEMERDMQLLGVTAVEDRIQQGVPETVNMLLRAGVKVWMLTGDNMETAINIGIACKLVEPSMRQYKLDAGNGDVTPDSVMRQLDEYHRQIVRQLGIERKPGDFKYCLVLHGKVLYTIMEEEQARLRQLFLAIACESCSVIACRLAPAQKAALVKLLKASVVGNPLTLAIGDGGNDVSMIQEAHVGVGILGVEGRQAANAADFTIGQFRFLQTMLFVHGRWNLRRISIVIGYSFYKNFLLVLPLAFYAPYNGFSGTTLYESYLLTTFNLAFTSFPILILGIFDIDVSARVALLVPSLYQLGIQRQYFNSWTLIGWIARGVLHAILTFVLMHLVMNGWSAGQTAPDQLVMGSWAYGACVCVANAILLLHTKAWMDWGIVILLASVLFFLPALSLYSDGSFFLAAMFEPQMVGVASCLFGHIRSWLGLVLVTAACVLSDLALLYCRKHSAPDAADLLQEVQAGHLSGMEKLTGDAWVELAQRKLSAEDWLRQLPPPPPRVHQLRPEGRVGLKPLRGRGPSSVRFQGDSKSTRWKVKSVVPIQEAEEAMEPSCSHSIITYPETYLERVRLSLADVAISLWRRQWCEMTVTELAGGLGYDRIEVSKHFKSALRSSVAQRHLNLEGDGPRFDKRGAAADKFDSRRAVLNRQVTPECSGGGRVSFAPSDGPAHSVSESTTLAHRNSLSSKESRASHPHAAQLATGSGFESNDVVQDLIYSVVTLRFLSSMQEVAFKKFLSKQAAHLFGLCLQCFVFACFVWFLYDFISDSEGSLLPLMGCAGCLVCCVVATCFMRSATFELRAESCIVAVVLVGILCKHAYDVLEEHTGLLFNTYFPVFIIAGLRVRFTYVLLVLLYHMVALLFRYWLLTGTVPLRSHEQRLTFLQAGGGLPTEYFVVMFGVTCLSLHYAYMLEMIMRKDFFVLDSIWRSKNQALEILNGMFPQEVVDHVLMKVRREEAKATTMRRLQEDRGTVTILFCDINDFDGITQKLKPMELVQLLDLVWMLFDRICERHGTVKIETVGKTYMAAAMPEDGSNACPEQHAKDAVAAVLTAIGMLGLVSKRFTGIGTITHVDVRIGAHTGRALSGVVGSTKPQFALFGDTVNTASRMQSTGKQGCLHVSSTTHELLKGDCRFEWQARQTEVKGKGLMDTYLLTRYHTDPEPRRQRKNTRTGSVPSAGSQPSVALSYSSPETQYSTDSLTTAALIGALPGPVAPASNSMALGSSRPGSPDRLVPPSGTPPDTGSSFTFLGRSAEEARGDAEERVQMQRELTFMSQENLKMRGKMAKHYSQRGDRSERNSSMASPEKWPFALVLRLGYMTLGLAASVVMYIVGRRHRWGAWASNVVSSAFADAIALAVFSGFLSAFLSNVLFLDGETNSRAFWIVFEGFFFVMVLMHLWRLTPRGVVQMLLWAIVVICILSYLGASMSIHTLRHELMWEVAGGALFLVLTHVIGTICDPRRANADHHAICEEHERVSELLDSMLPKEVLAEMKSGQLSLAYSYEDMTLLFADIVGFTRYCADHTAEQAVHLVTRLFAEFDEQAVKLGIYKVCTIGDAYVVVNEPRMQLRDKYGDCECVFTMAKHMLQTIARVREEVNHRDLDMRIGLHVGRFVGGVIGTKRLRFDVWGEDVLIGNNVESHGVAGQICVSQSAKEVLEQYVSELDFNFNQDMTLKTGRVVRTYVCRPASADSFLEDGLQ